MFHNILVSIDGSPQANQALQEAIDIALADNSRLTLLTSVRRCPSWAYSPVSAGAVQQLATDFERDAKRVMCDGVDRVPESIPVTKIITREPVKPALMRQLKSGKHDLLVMGSRGRGTVSASLLGSVSHYMLGHSPIPVLIANAPGDEPGERPQPHRPRQARDLGGSSGPEPAGGGAGAPAAA